MKDEFNKKSNFWRNFLGGFAVSALLATAVIDGGLMYPLMHESIFGQHYTAFMAEHVVPPADWVAGQFGLEPLRQTINPEMLAQIQNASDSFNSASSLVPQIPEGMECVLHGDHMDCSPISDVGAHHHEPPPLSAWDAVNPEATT